MKNANAPTVSAIAAAVAAYVVTLITSGNIALAAIMALVCASIAYFVSFRQTRP